MKKIGLVCTTIGDGGFLNSYCAEISAAGLTRDVTVYVIADKKSPTALWGNASRLRSEFQVECVNLHDQESYLTRLGLNDIIPWNSDNRRNIGYLRALEDGCETIISIDDDNFVIPNTGFFASHSRVGELEELREIEVVNGWYNVCKNYLSLEDYPRGFPYYARRAGEFRPFTEKVKKIIAVNQGMWVGDPDIDALSWVKNPETKVGWAVNTNPSFQIGEGTWLPINSQNTAVWSKAIPAYYFIPMGVVINGWKMDRMGDIFQGYFLEKCVKTLRHGIAVGQPFVHHARNTHNHLEDITKELPGIKILEELLPWLQEAKITNHSYNAAYQDLSQQLDWAVERSSFKFDDATRAYFHRVTFCMREWLKACRMVG